MPLDNSSHISQPLTRDELSKAICKSEPNKAPDIDCIVYGVLKNDPTIDFLTKFFNLCFQIHRVPEIWVQAFVYPTPKSSTNDSRVPLNYRGISSRAEIRKLCTIALNARLNNHTKTNGYIVNKQNGFRSHRSCYDHISVLENVSKFEMNSTRKHVVPSSISGRPSTWLIEMHCYMIHGKSELLGNFELRLRPYIQMSKAAYRFTTG